MATQLTAANSEYFEDDVAPVTASPFTFAAWVRCASDPSTNDFNIAQLSDKDVTNHHYRIGSDGIGGAFRLSVTAGGTSRAATATANMVQNTWHHVCAIEASAADRRAFMDGGNKGTNTDSRAPSGIDRISIGREGDSTPGDYWDGEMADACLWNVALTDLEVARLARGVDPRYIRPGSLIRYWDFMDGTSGRDLMGNQTLTAFNTPTQGSSGPPRTLYTPKWAASVPLIEAAGGGGFAHTQAVIIA